MARLARLVVPGLPHHITQRGNRRQRTFFHDEDYAAYVELMAEWCGKRGVVIWAYCLMPNHVHLIAVPQSEDGLRGDRRGSSALYSANQFSRKMAGVSVARAICLVRHGRAVPAGRRKVRGIEPGASRFGGRRRRMAVEQRTITPDRPRRPAGPSRPDAGDGRRLARCSAADSTTQNSATCATTSARAARWGAPRFWNTWSGSPVVSYVPESLVARPNYSNVHN